MSERFGLGDKVNIEDRPLWSGVLFDDCAITGSSEGVSIVGCEFRGRAADWFSRFIAPLTLMTVDLEAGRVIPGPAWRQE